MNNYNLVKATLKVYGLTFLLSISNQTAAHHSFSANFDGNTSIEVSGVITEFNFRNPHVNIYLDVKNADGTVTNWMAEGAAASGWRRGGWTKDSLKPGDAMKISGNATHDGSPMVSIRQMAMLNPDDMTVIAEVSTGQAPTGIEVSADQPAQANNANEIFTIPLTLATGEPNFTGTSVEDRSHIPQRQGRGGGDQAQGEGRERGGAGDQARGERPERGGDQAQGEGRQRGGANGAEQAQGAARAGPDSNDPEMPYNEVGKQALAAFDLVNDPQVFCEPVGVVRQSAYTPYGFKLTQYPDHVTIVYEEFGTKRAVFFDDELPKPGIRTHMGDSVARYEGDALIIETVNILSNPSGHRGKPLSDEARVTEVYTREDSPELGSIVKVESTVVDPKYLTEPWTISRRNVYVDDNHEYIENGCAPPLRERPANVYQYTEFDKQFLE